MHLSTSLADWFKLTAWRALLKRSSRPFLSCKSGEGSSRFSYYVDIIKYYSRGWELWIFCYVSQIDLRISDPLGIRIGILMNNRSNWFNLKFIHLEGSWTQVWSPHHSAQRKKNDNCRVYVQTSWRWWKQEARRSYRRSLSRTCVRLLMLFLNV